MLVKLDKLNYKKGMVCLGLAGMIFQAQAEVLVILPESGPMARAGNSIKQGIVSAHQASHSDLTLKFINTDQKNLKDLLKNNVTKKTQMVIGPLARQAVDVLIAENPKVPVLALNEVAAQHPNVWQFSLAKDEDAAALLNVLTNDKIKKIYVMRQAGTEQDTLSFINALYKRFEGHVDLVDQIPRLKSKEGLLLLGNNAWLNMINGLPTKNIYAQAISVEENHAIPVGLKFCDVPGIYQNTWQDLIQLTRSNPMSMAFQRLYAFGGDAWQIAEYMISTPQQKSMKLSGRTGELSFDAQKMNLKNTPQRIQRRPSCFINTAQGLSLIK